MNYLNNSDSSIFKNTVQKQSDFIEKKLKKTNIRYLTDNVKLTGTIDEIVNHLNMGIAQNLIHTFFKYDTKNQYCVHCKKNKKEVKQLERAHCNRNDCNRTFLLRKAVISVYTNDKTPTTKDILKIFIINHKKCPIYYLCKSCHHNYDIKMPKYNYDNCNKILEEFSSIFNKRTTCSKEVFLKLKELRDLIN